VNPSEFLRRRTSCKITLTLGRRSRAASSGYRTGVATLAAIAASVGATPPEST
jgi:hypothetical protein